MALHHTDGTTVHLLLPAPAATCADVFGALAKVGFEFARDPAPEPPAQADPEGAQRVDPDG